jgi:hypothetical protein
MVSETDQDDEELAMTWLMINIPLMVLFFALWVGVPVWLVLKRSDTRPKVATTAISPPETKTSGTAALPDPRAAAFRRPATLVAGERLR